MKLLSGALVATLAVACGTQAMAQAAAAPAAPAATPTNPGPVIPGVCIFSNERAVGASAAGRAVATRMQQLQQAVNAELTPERTAIQAEGTAVEGLRASNPQQYQTRGQALVTRAQAFEQRVQLRAAELQATERRQVERISEAMEPIVQQIYAQRNCGLLVNRNAVFAGNPQMDITDAVIAQLNTRLPTLTFERERINPQQAGGQQGAAAPAAAAPAAPRR